MSRTVKIAGACLLGGLLATVAVVAARHAAPREAATIIVPDETSDEPAAEDMARCRAITVPDSACAAAWDARRRHFFGQDARP